MSAPPPSLRRALSRLALGACLCWSALRAAGLPRPSLSPENAKALWERARELRDNGRARKALSATHRLLATFPDNHIYLSFAADLYQELKAPAREAAALELFMTVAPIPTDACPKLGRAYRAQVQVDRALEAHRRCLSLDPTKSDLLFFLAHELERQDQVQEAQRLYQQLIARSPDYSDASLGLARLKLGAGDLDGAKVLIDKVLAKSPLNTDALAAAAALAEKRGDLKTARELLKTAIGQSPSYADLYRILGRVSLKAGDKEQALKAFTALHDLEPDDSAAARKARELRGALRP